MENNNIPDDIKEKIDSEISKSEIKYEKSYQRKTEEDPILTLIISGKKISGNTVKEFYRKIMTHLKYKGIPYDKEVPYATGYSRYLINDKNTHIKGEKFTSPIEFDGFFLETHKSKTGAKKDMIKFLNKLGVEVGE